jgi:hypothetical protein
MVHAVIGVGTENFLINKLLLSTVNSNLCIRMLQKSRTGVFLLSSTRSGENEMNKVGIFHGEPALVSCVMLLQQLAAVAYMFLIGTDCQLT